MLLVFHNTVYYSVQSISFMNTLSKFQFYCYSLISVTLYFSTPQWINEEIKPE